MPLTRILKMENFLQNGSLQPIFTDYKEHIIVPLVQTFTRRKMEGTFIYMVRALLDDFGDDVFAQFFQEA